MSLASMCRAMAERLDAGEAAPAVLADYSLMWVPKELEETNRANLAGYLDDVARLEGLLAERDATITQLKETDAMRRGLIESARLMSNLIENDYKQQLTQTEAREQQLREALQEVVDDIRLLGLHIDETDCEMCQQRERFRKLITP